MGMNTPATTKVDRSDRGRLDRFYGMLDQFDLCGELSKRVFQLGRPHFSDSGSTASLAVSAEGKPLFRFNRTFFDSLGPCELGFVLLHHLRRKDRLLAIWNIACDLVVNYFLLHHVGFGKMTDPRFRKFLRSAITFESLSVSSPRRRPHLTAEEVYELLNKDFQRVLKAAPDVVACDEHAWALAQARRPGRAPPRSGAGVR
jgi:hypothetical protein